MQCRSRAGKYVLFLGAGASKPFGSPDMAELFATCDHAVRTYSPSKRGDDWAQGEGSLWTAVCRQLDPDYDKNLASSLQTGWRPGGLGQNRKGDLEAVLQVLDVLSSDAFPDAFNAAGGAPTANTPTQFPDQADISQRARRLHEFVNEEIVGRLRPLPVAQLSGSYEQLLGPLRGLGPELVATTNYDTNLEQRASPLKLYDGFDESGNWRGFPEEASSREAEWSVDLVKLHGSINWYSLSTIPEPEVRRSDLTVGMQSFGTDGLARRPYLLLPAMNKDQASDRVSAVLRERLWRGLMRAEMVLCIGYSLRDEYLASLFLSALIKNTDLRLLLVGPNAEAIRSDFVGIADEQVHAVAAKCGDRDFAERISRAIREDMGMRLVEPPSTSSVSFRSKRWTPIPESASMGADALAFGGRAIVIDGAQHPITPTMILWGPYATLEQPGRYQAFFRICANGAVDLPTSRDAVVLEVASRRAPVVAPEDKAETVNQRVVRAGELPDGQFVTFNVDFEWDLDVWDSSSLELRIFTIPRGDHPQGISELRIDTRWIRYTGPLA